MTSYEKLDLRYVGTIGSGTFGRVDLAWSEPSKQHYAVKKFSIHDVVQEGHTEYVNRERQILRCLDNPFIVKLCINSHLRVCTQMDKFNLFLVTEFVEGGELRDYLGDMSEEDLYAAVRFYSMEIICALRHIHPKNIVLRDLKPENLLLSRDGHVKISDFGLAKVLKGKTYTICGTPEFMAPEILSKKGYGMDVDWWSLGILLFELITGRTPFSGDTQEETFEAIRKGDLRFPDGFHAEAR
ncbi:hypothetical protein Y032_0206g1954 [Ancylostoma ceylanicum]|uniref:Protein kinase domain-containing protein n=1 Tax=Ancylostoma ceylanicum TaxID=53326 RepID=A0A016SKX7_9BILA|nr:hypothetical protein Y032_0206g1954 [Ancylostoma ceylanicum]